MRLLFHCVFSISFLLQVQSACVLVFYDPDKVAAVATEVRRGGEMNLSLNSMCGFDVRLCFDEFVWSETSTSSSLDEFVRKEALILMAPIDFLQVQSGALSASNQ